MTWEVTDKGEFVMDDLDFVVKVLDGIKTKLVNGEKITDQDLKNFDLLIKNKRLLQEKSTSIQGYFNELNELSSKELKDIINDPIE